MSRHYRRATLDFTVGRINAFNEAKGGGVSVRKDVRGYSLFREDTGMPIARLRPVLDGEFFDVYFWSDRDKWEPVGYFGGIRLRLDEALEYIADDPLECFWR